MIPEAVLLTGANLGSENAAEQGISGDIHGPPVPQWTVRKQEGSAGEPHQLRVTG
jgi:hypothetical protein